MSNEEPRVLIVGWAVPTTQGTLHAITRDGESLNRVQ